IITDLCILEPEADTNEFVVTTLHPGVTREQVIAATGWEVRIADTVLVSEEPTDIDLTALRDLEARTAAANGEVAGEA
ncbi:CoA-transferase subunit beta, partial [Pseudomonas syringae pv. tagetis]